MVVLDVFTLDNFQMAIQLLLKYDSIKLSLEQIPSSMRYVILFDYVEPNYIVQFSLDNDYIGQIFYYMGTVGIHIL